MKKILFMIPTLGQGGAEKVLVNLVNHMDSEKYEITVMTLFDVGINKKFLASHIHYKFIFRKIFRGNTKILALFSPKFLHDRFIKEKYDIEISYLEGPTARIIAGGKQNIKNTTKFVTWIHTEEQRASVTAYAFRSYKEAERLYNSFDRVVGVSKNVAETFQQVYNLKNSPKILYNTVESEWILEKSNEPLDNIQLSNADYNIIAVGSLKAVKGFDRLIAITKKLLVEGLPIHTYILGQGDDLKTLKEQAKQLNVTEKVTFLGYDTNPYKYVAKCDLFVCSSHREGFSTAVTEALIVGTPVCTTQVSGMQELLGENNEYGLITDNNEEALYQGMYRILTEQGLLTHYKQKARERGKQFFTERTVRAVEDFLDTL